MKESANALYLKAIEEDQEENGEREPEGSIQIGCGHKLVMWHMNPKTTNKLINAIDPVHGHEVERIQKNNPAKNE